MVSCDPDSDGYTEFTLHDADLAITGGDPALTVTYHYTYLDAQTDENELLDPFVNINPYDDRVWARVESTTTSCYAIVELLLEVRDSPVLTEPTPYRLCDGDGDGFEVFDLNAKRSEVLNGLDPLRYDLYFYQQEQDAIDAGMAALTAPDFSLAIGNPGSYTNATPNSQTIYVLGVGTAANTTPNNGASGCYDIVPLQLIVDPAPTAVEPADYRLCDDELNGSTPTDQISTFDLTTRDLEVSGGVPGLLVTWFETPADEAADLPIAVPGAYQNISNAQTVVARLSNGFGCRDLVTLTLVVESLPTPAQPEPLELCDQGGGFAEFDLSLRTAEIINGEPGVVVRYFPERALAEAGGPGEIIAPFLYTNDDPFSDSVWARVENVSTDCYALVELQLIVVPLPDAPDATFMDPYLVCDLDGDGQAIFDLTAQDASVYGAQDPGDFLPVTYYTDLVAAQAGANPIDPAGAFPSAGQPIWVRLESAVTGCVRITEFQLEVGAFPVHGSPLDLEACDDELNGSTGDDGVSTFDLTQNTPLILGGDPTLTVLYYASQGDLDNDIPIAAPGAYQNVVVPQQEIFVSIAGQNSCRAAESFFITVLPNPEPVQPSPLFGCDVDNDGITQFDLDSKIAEIQGGDPTLAVTFHETRLDAVNGQYALTSPYQNIVLFNQTLYVRAAFAAPPAGTGCYTVLEMELVVAQSPELPQDLPDLTACDQGGFHEFNLRENEDLVLGGQDPDDFTVTYHLSRADAEAGTPFIAQPESYTNTSNPQTIWVRLADTASGCYKVGSFDLVVTEGLPITDPEPWAKCDDLGVPFDGTALFDLTSRNAEITNGVLTQGVHYFETEQDAQEGQNPIDPDTAYANTSNPQVLYVRVEDSNSGCIAYTTLTISVVANPSPVAPDPIELCDVTVIVPPGPYDETELFDLTVREAQILNGNGWTLGYYESYDDAVNQNAEIVAPELTAYQNTSNPQTIYVRTTNAASLCFEIVELELIVNPLPDDTAVVSPYILCAPDDSEIGVFNLETKVGEILGGQPQPPFAVSFYLDPADAESGDNAIVNTTAHQNKDANNDPINPQLIYTGILNTETGCYIGGLQSFELIVQRGAVAVAPAEPFVICDNVAPSDGFAEFDLGDLSSQQVSDLRAGILAGQDPAVYEITFHETVGSAEAGAPAIAFPYTNIINPQRIYARVTNTANPFSPQCYAVAEVILKVEQLPEVLLEGEYRLCVDENGNPIAEEEGSPSPPVIDTGLDPALYSFVWELDGMILVGENGPSIIALQGGAYTVSYTELATGCEGTAGTTVTVSSPPFTYGASLLNGAFAGNHIIEATATGDGTYVYQLDDGPFQDSNIFENVDPGAHTITIKDIYGCGSVTLEVGVIDYPPYFTPNADGYHDTWNIIGIATGDPAARIYIFDRFGKLLKQLSPLGPGWDGTYGGSLMPSSDYWFRVEYTEDGAAKEFKGHFTLKR
ncbi:MULTISPECIES: T9SS type B sorting domain-containing protein [Aequorivita]|uniref:T9SS type B sorting domain-containing protein n=1 Tax=Aequorivita iocasae TaxID=2803865 RepID=A0ABX7DUV2_9FLAO|nr:MULTISPECIES: T9SS type B sorting domain-containing protein [Aequorivita]QQX77931.1 T9SS type B sorting domain-containing protein [Aequorivita iocasae]UCA57432.1 T9SS type B sorting domain-containing protein [Aequorivita sp. F7]